MEEEDAELRARKEVWKKIGASLEAEPSAATATTTTASTTARKKGVSVVLPETKKIPNKREFLKPEFLEEQKILVRRRKKALLREMKKNKSVIDLFKFYCQNLEKENENNHVVEQNSEILQSLHTDEMQSLLSSNNVTIDDFVSDNNILVKINDENVAEEIEHSFSSSSSDGNEEDADNDDCYNDLNSSETVSNSQSRRLSFRSEMNVSRFGSNSSKGSYGGSPTRT